MSESKAREEYERFWGEENLRPQVPPRTRKSGLSEMLRVPTLAGAAGHSASPRPCRGPIDVLARRRAIERHLDRKAQTRTRHDDGGVPSAVGVGRLLHARLHDAAERAGVDVTELANQVIAHGLGTFEERSGDA